MLPLPAKFAYLAKEPGPKALLEALKWHGLREVPGPASSPVIMGWAKAVGAASYYPSDATPWCALFLSYCLKQGGYPLSADPLRALSWLRWGTPAPGNRPALGDIMVYERAGGGHVTFYVGEDATHFYCLGGNQGDSVCIAGFPKVRAVTVRRCPWRNGQPANVRAIAVGPGGPTAAVSEV